MSSSPNNSVEVPAASEILYNEEYMPPFAPVLVIVFPLMPFFWKYHVRVVKSSTDNNNDVNIKATSSNSTSLSFGYSSWLSSNTFNLDEIDTVQPISHINGLTEYGGWGIKMKLGNFGTTGYIAKNGPGIKLTATNKKGKTKKYVFNCDNPQKVCDLINQHKSDIGGGADSDDDLSKPLIS